MYKEVLSSIENIGIYPVFSFIVFFIFFTMIAAWLLRSKTEDFEMVSQLPLTENEQN
ncbi:MAG: CcoQ/FixQ family Cbb3-type cytochrome c oxidase assembly chaperone [Bacteroidetes bacterium]|nr:CcoQ/FixQ family Cbb3-type cytochrome c oxidase assembly chaperone [Bacteroidota bacterium]